VVTFTGRTGVDLPPLNVATFRERISGGANQGRAIGATLKEAHGGRAIRGPCHLGRSESQPRFGSTATPASGWLVPVLPQWRHEIGQPVKLTASMTADFLAIVGCPSRSTIQPTS